MVDNHAGKQNRRSIRIKEYDYLQPGWYFTTICTQNCETLFGSVVDGKMILNGAGEMVHRWYHELAKNFHDIQCDQFVCMPNHVHMILANAVGADLRVCPHSVWCNGLRL